MPSVGAMIAGTITFFIGAFILSYFKSFGEHMDDSSYTRGNGSGKFVAFVGGIGLIFLGLNTALHLSVTSVMMLIPAVPLLWHFKPAGQVLITFLSRQEPSPKATKAGQIAVFIIALDLAGWAVWLSVREWI